jgi:hypothetical protein
MVRVGEFMDAHTKPQQWKVRDLTSRPAEALPFPSDGRRT